jgi:hypothetical protein
MPGHGAKSCGLKVDVKGAQNVLIGVASTQQRPKPSRPERRVRARVLLRIGDTPRSQSALLRNPRCRRRPGLTVGSQCSKPTLQQMHDVRGL